MQRSAWIFLSAILLPSLGLAWLAIHSVRDQQVVVQHQEAIICQNLTDTLAKNIQTRMDAIRQDFVRTTGIMVKDTGSAEELSGNFNQRLHRIWPLAEIGFAVNLDGQIYSPQPRDGISARKFRDENDRFLSNRENAEVYFSNGLNSSSNLAGNNSQTQAPSSTVWAGNAPVGGSIVITATASGQLDLQSRDRKLNVADASSLGPPNQESNALRNAALKDSQEKMETQGQAGMKEAQTKSATSSPAATTATAATPAPAEFTQKNQDRIAPATVADLDKAQQDDNAHLREKAVDTEKLAQADQLEPAQGAAHSVPPAQAPVATTTPMNASAATGSASSGVPGGAPNRRGGLEPGTPPPPAPVVTDLPTMETPVTSSASPSAPADTGVMAPDAAANATMAPPPPQSSPMNAAGKLNNTLQQIMKIQRNVVPQQQLAQSQAVSLSNTVPAESDFRQVIGSEASGSLARFLDNKLFLMVWSHTPVDSPIIFGAQLDQARLIKMLNTSYQDGDLTVNDLAYEVSSDSDSNYCLAILDDSGHPVALSRDGFAADWKHPFVATELGDALPHWEAALYLIDPHQIDRTARTLQLTLGLIVLLLVAAIVAGGSLIATDVRRQVRLAQQKTDFVSNVSHELKTPLTSIRMFADLLAEKRVPDEQKQSTYLRIIAAEAARLTRLINNVLDFARLERGAPPGEHHACDLVDAVRDVIETCQPHLETSGIAFHSEIETEKLPMVGDRDALAQIILNLVSNAEKYGGNDVTVRVRRQDTAAGALGCVDVLDRGAGISPRDMKTIFEPFHRLDDSLASGIPGSGLGLTLSRRMARAHGGDVTCSARAGGGTCFTLSVPLTPSKS